MVNILLNSGFEIVDPTVPTRPQYWKTYQTGTAHIYSYPEPGRDGIGKSVSTQYPTLETGKLASWVQSLRNDITKSYKLAGWIKTENIIGKGAIIKVDWKDSNWAYIGMSTIMPRRIGTTPWTYYEGIISSTTAYGMTVVLELWDSSGKVWFDDILIEETAPLVPSVKVISPNGGETLIKGSTINITWIGTDIYPHPKIELFKGGVFNRQIVYSSPTPNIYSWTLPNDLPTGDDYKIKITACAGLSTGCSSPTVMVTDMSDNNFSIIEPCLIPASKLSII